MDIYTAGRFVGVYMYRYHIPPINIQKIFLGNKGSLGFSRASSRRTAPYQSEFTGYAG